MLNKSWKSREMASLLYLALLVASPEICFAKQAYFSAIDAEDVSVQSDLIATFDTPSELSCSQRCFRHEECKYKKYDASSQKCELFKSLAEEDVTEMALVSKKETYVDTDSSISKETCGGKCSLLTNLIESPANVVVCDCRELGVFKTCSAALSVNNLTQAMYWIFPRSLSKLLAVLCKRDRNGNSVAVFHHDSETPKTVNDFEAAGSYRRNLTYKLDKDSIISIINQSGHCEQHTKAECYHVYMTLYVWLSDRHGQKLAFWGGGPSDGTGCGCGIDSSCAGTGGTSKKCNCDANDSQWRTDEGYITKREVLPITAISAGDTGSDIEKFVYTLGPLQCVF